ncbi:MAG TPA: hypothetical protein VKF37_12135 [Chloroflexota bacterium]|nr:hypothetical protein [Chloroflexota bacterium]
MDNEQIIRKVDEAAAIQDGEGFVAAFTEDGVVHDMSSGTLYHGHAERGARIRQETGTPSPRHLVPRAPAHITPLEETNAQSRL